MANGEKVQVVTNFLFLGSTVTADIDCSLEIRRYLLLGKRVMTSIDSTECSRIDAFKLWCWRRLLKVPWTARSNLLILREINSEYLLEGLMLKLKFQYFGHLMRTDDSLEKSLMLGKTEGRRRRHQEDEMAGQYHQCNEHELWANSRRW